MVVAFYGKELKRESNPGHTIKTIAVPIQPKEDIEVIYTRFILSQFSRPIEIIGLGR